MRRPFLVLRRALYLTLAVILAPTIAASQNTASQAGQLLVTRAQLQEALDQYQRAGSSSEWSAEFKVRAKSEADLVQRRLLEGDFQVGDQITLTVEGEFDNKQQTLTVGLGRIVPIPGMQELSLEGVLRSELNEKVRLHISRFIRNPVVRTETMIRISVMGQVGAPTVGLILPAQSLISEAITRAGGPTSASDIPKSYVLRGTARIWEGEALQRAIADGRTLDQMQLRSGDQLTIPEQGAKSAPLMRFIAVLPAALLAITGILAIF